MQKYAFIDRDGTIITELGRDEDQVAFPPKSIDEINFMEGSIQGMKSLLDSGYKLVLATNQAYLGTNKNPQDIFESTMSYFYKKLEDEGIKFEYSMVCPHGPRDGCSCRKPQIGGLKEFLEKRQNNIDIFNSVMFGDRETDKIFANNLGVKFVEVGTNGTFIVPSGLLEP